MVEETEVKHENGLNEVVSAEENGKVSEECKENLTATPPEVTSTDQHNESQVENQEKDDTVAVEHKEVPEVTLNTDVTDTPTSDEENKTRAVEEEKKIESGEEEEDIPLSRLRQKEPTPEEEQKPKVNFRFDFSQFTIATRFGFCLRPTHSNGRT